MPTIRNKLLSAVASASSLFGQIQRVVHNPHRYKCSHKLCEQRFKSRSGLVSHERTIHKEAAHVLEPTDVRTRVFHPHCTGGPHLTAIYAVLILSQPPR
jgi:hypothetical protein